MNELFIRAAVQTADPGGALPESGAAQGTEPGAGPSENSPLPHSGTSTDPFSDDPDRPVTMGELQQILHTVLSGLRVYVLESDISSSQNDVRAIAEQSKF